MIEFRCWYCNRRHRAPERRIGERITCKCAHTLRVPARGGGDCRVKTFMDWVVEAVVYGGAGALAGLGLDVLIVLRLRFLVRLWMFQPFPWIVLGALPLAGFLIGFLGGESAVGLLARRFRDDEWGR